MMNRPSILNGFAMVKVYFPSIPASGTCGAM
jgi:hypothetical protein